MSNARNLSKFKPSSSGLVETADIADDGITNAKVANDAIDTAQIADDAVSTDQIANNAVINTSGAITTTGAFTSVGIDDNADGVAMTIDTNEDVELNNGGLYVTGSLNSLTVDKGGIDRSGNTTRIISGRSGGNYADFSINIAGTGSAVNRQVYIDYQGNMTLDNGNLTIGTSGKGIDFSAQTGGTALSSGDGTENPTTENEVLKHYEHGTFKPKVVSSGATFDYQGSGGQYGSGHYTRIGDLVFIDINLDSDGGVSGTLTNAIQVQNLPFTGNTGGSMNTEYFYRRVSDSSHPHLLAQQYSNYISFLQSPNSGQWRSLKASQVNFTDHRWKISGCYHIGTI